MVFVNRVIERPLQFDHSEKTQTSHLLVFSSTHNMAPGFIRYCYKNKFVYGRPSVESFKVSSPLTVLVKLLTALSVLKDSKDNALRGMFHSLYLAYRSYLATSGLAFRRAVGIPMPPGAKVTLYTSRVNY